MSLAKVLAEIARERQQQDVKWGEQNHPDGTGRPGDGFQAEMAREICKANGPGEDNWRDILTEEVHEAYAEVDPLRLRAELVQVAAVVVAWIEAIDRRGPGSTSPEPGPGYEIRIAGEPVVVTPLPPKWQGAEYLSRHPEEFPDGPCERCRNRPSVGRCCSSHSKELCHRCYRVTHFVEVCSVDCQRCAAEQLPPILTRERPAESTKDGTEEEPEPGTLYDESAAPLHQRVRESGHSTEDGAPR